MRPRDNVWFGLYIMYIAKLHLTSELFRYVTARERSFNPTSSPLCKTEVTMLPSTLLLSVMTHIMTDIMAEASFFEDFCYNYNGTQIPFGDNYLKTACQECECWGMESGEAIGPCYEVGYDCGNCNTTCCRQHCSDDNLSDNILDRGDAFKNTGLNPHYSMIISVGGATVFIVLGLLIYLYRRRVTSYVRVTRRLYMERQLSANAPKPRSPDLPPNYEDITMDGGPANLPSPPRYDDLVPPYSFAVLQRHDVLGNSTGQNNSISTPPDVDS